MQTGAEASLVVLWDLPGQVGVTNKCTRVKDVTSGTLRLNFLSETRKCQTDPQHERRRNTVNLDLGCKKVTQAKEG